MTLKPGTKLGRYELRSKIGADGMGDVYSISGDEMPIAAGTKLGRFAKRIASPMRFSKLRLHQFLQPNRA